MTEPPGNSLEADQGGRVVDPGEELADGLHALLVRIGEELDFNEANGTAPYRMGMVADLLHRHGHDAQARERPVDA